MDDKSEILQEIQLINLLFELETESCADVFRQILVFCDLKNVSTISMIACNIYHAVYARNYLLSQLIELTKMILSEISDDLKEIFQDSLYIPILIEDKDYVSYTPYESVFLYGFLCYSGIIDIEIDFEYIKHFLNTHELHQDDFLETFKPFLWSTSGLLKEKHPKFFDYVMELLEAKDKIVYEQINTYIDLNISPYQLVPSKQLHEISTKFSTDYYLHHIISCDNVDLLQEFCSNPNIDINLRLNESFGNPSEILLYHPTLIDVSAYYASIKCFKFLYLNNASLNLLDDDDNTLATFAVIGGNLEIVKICLSNKVDFADAAFAAISYHRNQIFYWLLDEGFVSLSQKSVNNLTLMHSAAESNNLEIAQFLISNGFKLQIDENEVEDLFSPFHLSCVYDCINIVKLFCVNFEIPKNTWKQCITISIKTKTIELFKYLFDLYIKKFGFEEINFFESIADKVGNEEISQIIKIKSTEKPL